MKREKSLTKRVIINLFPDDLKKLDDYRKQQRKVDVSEGHWEKCEECHGVGTVPPFGSTCTHCDGFKRIWVAVPPKPPHGVLKSRRSERAIR
jgi:RecJ-like exonuclease